MASRLILYEQVIRPYITEHAVRLVDRTATQVARAARIAAPKKTGLLADSIHTILEPGDMKATARVGSELSYAASVHQGTRAHEIEARPGHVLFMPGVGFAERVEHPRTRGTPFLTDPLERIGRELNFLVIRGNLPD